MGLDQEKTDEILAPMSINELMQKIDELDMGVVRQVLKHCQDRVKEDDIRQASDELRARVQSAEHNDYTQETKVMIANVMGAMGKIRIATHQDGGWDTYRKISMEICGKQVTITNWLEGRDGSTVVCDDALIGEVDLYGGHIIVTERFTEIFGDLSIAVQAIIMETINQSQR